MVTLDMEHVLILVIVAFVLYHFVGRCQCNGFRVGGQIIPQIIPKDEINSQDSISNLQDLCKEVVTCSDCGQFAYDPCTLELQNALRRDLNIPRAIYCTNYWKHNANGDRIQCLYDPTNRECKLPSRVESGH